MSEFDRIIGYTDIKQELIQIADTLKNREIYQALGAASPRGLLLYGVPGVGKSLMAKCLINASGRETFTCRKTEPDGEFVKTIKETFDRAAESAPSIVFLDDLDKFSNEDSYHRDSDEYVTVQSCIDEVRGKEVFVLATANDIDKLPRSLVRSGRFDRKIKVETPRGKDAEDIIRYYLSRKKLAEGMDPGTIAEILSGKSCAALEIVINEASLMAGYQRADRVTMEHIMEACLRIVFKLRPGTHIAIDLSDDNSGARTVYHEAAHAVISELLAPGSVTLVIARCDNGSSMGVTRVRKEERGSIRCWAREVLVSLAGRAATELHFGSFDTGSCRDLDDAFEAARNLVEDHCYKGFSLYSYGHRHDNSQELIARQETAIATMVEESYRKVKAILYQNRVFFEAVAHALAEKGILTASDICDIRKNCAISDVAA